MDRSLLSASVDSIPSLSSAAAPVDASPATARQQEKKKEKEKEGTSGGGGSSSSAAAVAPPSPEAKSRPPVASVLSPVNDDIITLLTPLESPSANMANEPQPSNSPTLEKPKASSRRSAAKWRHGTARAVRTGVARY